MPRPPWPNSYPDCGVAGWAGQGEVETAEDEEYLKRRTGGCWHSRRQPFGSSTRVVEQRHEAKVHVQLLVTVKEGHAWIVSDEVKFELLKTAQQHPGVWALGDLSDDDRGHCTGIVIEYAGYNGEAQWTPPKPFQWDYTQFGKAMRNV